MKSVLQGFIPPEDATAGEEGEPLSPSSEAAAPSPRAQRAADAASALLNPADLGLHHLEPQDTYGMRSRQFLYTFGRHVRGYYISKKNMSCRSSVHLYSFVQNILWMIWIFVLFSDPAFEYI